MTAPHAREDDRELLFAIMPPRIQREMTTAGRADDLIEIILDLGRPAEMRFPDRMEIPSSAPVTMEDINYVISRVGSFGDDNRAGIQRTLHRISAIRNRVGTIIGITCRVGRSVPGTVDFLRDIIDSGKSVLLLGRPGVGKTTLLREAARVLADELGKRVIIVDTSNEIGGDGDIPHPGIGRARRMQVPSVARQHAVMIEAVENHMPEVIVIDEIGTEAEAEAARTIAERGVQLIATAHGNSLDNLLQNPTLADLVGGIQAVTLSDEEARRRRTRKTVLERKAPPTFDVLVEIQQRDKLVVHHELAAEVDRRLAGQPGQPELRIRDNRGEVAILPAEASATTVPDNRAIRRKRTTRIFTYGVSRERLERLIEKLGLDVGVVDDPGQADLLLTIKSQEKRQPRRLRELRSRGIPLYSLKSNTVMQLEGFLRSLFDRVNGASRDAALLEAEEAITLVMSSGRAVELTPQPANIRAQQHQLAQRNGLMTESKGKGAARRVVVYP